MGTAVDSTVENEQERTIPSTRKKRMGIGTMLALDALCIAVGLNVFAWFHHVRDYYFPTETAEAAPITLITPTPQPTPAPETTPEAEATEPPRVYSGVWGEKFADKFTDGEVEQTEYSYRSENVFVTVTPVKTQNLSYTVADIYISDLKYLRTAFGPKGYGSRGYTADLAQANGAVVALSGDYYSFRREGVVVRNGTLYRDTRFDDVCILLGDGRMVTIPNSELDIDALKEASPWQVWSFGPRVLEDGKAMTSFNSTVVRANPRAAIGYVEPGHYYFVQVDGRNKNGSRGMTMQQLAQLFEELGCETAYNLDGGETAGIAWMGELLSYAYGRTVSDIIYITDQSADTEG